MPMEAHEEGFAKKAKIFIQKLSHHFKLMIMLLHDQKEKSSNVSWWIKT